ncbi:hypothetical protein L7F22_010352 [Adiantum nelumboides]|nr:hypothetical protein [Adiantum nelumboides]
MDIMKGFILHGEVLKKGLEKEDSVGDALLEFYANCSPLADLENLFYNLYERDVTNWNRIIQGHAHHGLIERACSCLEHMCMEGVLPDVVSWNSLVLGFTEAGRSVKSMELFLLMQAHSLPPDRVMLVSTLKACGDLAALEFGKRIHAQSCQLMDYKLCNTLIDMYGKCGSMSFAQVVFDAMTSKNLVTWNALLAGYARHGAGTLAFHYFDEMNDCCVEPDEVTFLNVLNACRHAGLLSRGQEWFEASAMKSGLSLNVKRYTCMIDHYGRAGHVNEVMVMVDNMPVHPDLVLWEMVLGSCHEQGNAGAGRRAFNFLARLDESQSTAYLLLSNMYANAID